MVDKRRRFGARLRELRLAAGMTQRELARAARSSQRAISHYEQGLRQPKWESVQALADALGTDVSAFRQPPARVRKVPRGRPRKPHPKE
jgi:transcriptional regulator with XRE-family HTH domain